MTRSQRAGDLCWGVIAFAALGACTPLHSSESSGHGGDEREIDAGHGGTTGSKSPAKTDGVRAYDAAAEDGASTISDAGPGEREKAEGGAGRAAAAGSGRGTAGIRGAAAGSGGTSGAGAPASQAGTSGVPIAGAPASLPKPAPLKSPTVCPGLGEVQLNWRNAMIPLPGSGSEFLHLLADGECSGSPIATAVSAKLQLINRTNTVQIAECWLSSTKSSDYIKPQLSPRGTATVFLQIASAAGGPEHSNLSTVMCRNAGPAAGELAVTWIKLATEAVGVAEVGQAP